MRWKTILANSRSGIPLSNVKLSTTLIDLPRTQHPIKIRMQHPMEASPLVERACFPHVSFVGLTERNALPLLGRRQSFCQLFNSFFSQDALRILGFPTQSDRSWYRMFLSHHKPLTSGGSWGKIVHDSILNPNTLHPPHLCLLLINCLLAQPFHDK